MSPTLLIQYQSQVFFPGSPISGCIEVVSDCEISCNAVVIELKGNAHVHFTRQEKKPNSENDTETVHYRSNEDYYQIKTILWTNSHGQNLAAGKHQFPFSFILPNSAPSSFETEIGQIRHIGKATLKMSSFFKRNIKCSRPYSVISIVDLNMNPSSRNQILASDDKTLCCLCCASGPISVLLNVDKSGYVPGENIIINAECSNKSNREMKSSRVDIIQRTTFRAQGQTEDKERVVRTKKHGSIPPGGDDIWSGEQVFIPPLPPSDLPGCSIIDIKYFLKFVLEPSGPAVSLKLVEPLIIGTIPLQNQFSAFVPGPAALNVFPSLAAPVATVHYNPSAQYPPGAPTPYPAGPPGPYPPGAASPYPPGVPTPYPPGAPSPYPPGAPSPYSPGTPGPYPGGAAAPPYPVDNPPPYSEMSGAPSAPPLGFPGLNTYPNMPPPSYNDCTFGLTTFEYDTSDDEDSSKRKTTSQSFVPQYISYNLGNAQQGLNNVPAQFEQDYSMKAQLIG